MKDYLITVERQEGMSANSIITERLINKSEDYANGVLYGLKLAFPENEVYMTEIKKLKQ